MDRCGTCDPENQTGRLKEIFQNLYNNNAKNTHDTKMEDKLLQDTKTSMSNNRQDSLLMLVDRKLSVESLSSQSAASGIEVTNGDPYPEISITEKEGSKDSDDTNDSKNSENSQGTKDTNDSKDSSSVDSNDNYSYIGSLATHLKLKTALVAENIKTKTTDVVNVVVPIATDAVTVIIPKYEPLPHDTFLSLVFACSVPAILYIIGFTKMGYGVQVYNFLSTRIEHHAYLMGIGLAGVTFLLYLFDVAYWKSPTGKWIRRTLYGFVVVGTSSLVLAISGDHPYGPISIYLVLSTLWLVSVHQIFFRKMAKRKYVTWLSGPLFCMSMLIFLAWFIWTFWKEENEWTMSIKLIDADVTGCEPDFTDLENCRVGNGTDVCFYPNGPASVYFPEGCDVSCRDVYGSCLNTFIIWSGPFLVSAGLLFLSFFTTFVGGRVSPEEEITKFAKIWLFLLFGLWVSASLAGAGAGFTFALAAITLAAFVASGVFLAVSYKRIEREERLQNLINTLMEKYASYLDIIRGLLVVTCTPIAIAYMIVAGLKQRIRSAQCFQCSKPPQSTMSLTPTDNNGIKWVTVEGRKLLKEFKSWNRASVFTWAIIWGVAFMTLSVLASKFTTLFLSWLIAQTMDMSLGVVTAIMIGVGILMFLLPPVPGAPIYLTMGIVVIPVGSENLGLTWSIVYAMGVSTFLKLLATAAQQKMIGGLLRNQVGVRQLVGVNTDLIRAMKLLLSEPGLGLPKVAILCGGPDWPTSVLCGIMGLPLLPILIGTLPVIALVIPTVLAGSFTYMSSMAREDGTPLYAWAGVGATLTAAIAALVLMGNILMAAYYVEQTVSTKGEELKKIPLDEEVKKKTDQEENFRKAYAEVTKWEVVPSFMKIMITSSVLCMTTCCYTVQLFQQDCFIPYKLTDTIEVKLHGNWKNLVKPLGWISLLLFTISLILLCIFYFWAKHIATAKCKEEQTTKDEQITKEETTVSGENEV